MVKSISTRADGIDMNEKMSKAEMIEILNDEKVDPVTGKLGHSYELQDALRQAIEHVPDDPRPAGYYCVVTDKGIHTVVYSDCKGAVRMGKWVRIIDEEELEGMTWLAMIDFSEFPEDKK